MTYKIKVTKDKNGKPEIIEGFCDIERFTGKMSVITFHSRRDNWFLGSSMSLPSDIEAARQIHECVTAAFARLAEIQGTSSNITKEVFNFVRRCKFKSGFEKFEVMHAADNNYTLCGKELNGMWFVESSYGKTKEDVTCRECKKVIDSQ